MQSYKNKDVIDYGMFALVNTVGKVGIFTHLIFIPLFYYLDLKPISYLNIFSTIVWSVCWIINNKGHPFRAITILTVEVCIYTFISIYLLGWNVGFQYFLFAAMPFIMFNSQLKMKTIILISGSIFIYFAALHAMTHQIESIPVKGGTEYFLIVSNALITFFAIGISSYHFRYAASKSYEKVQVLADTDELTGLFNRRKVTKDLHFWQRSNTNTPFCLILADIDDFKKVNDTYGHAIGDKVIKEVSNELRKNLRRDEVVARWGGEEFLVALPLTRLDTAYQVAERMRQSIEKYIIEGRTTTRNITLTLGVVEHRDMERIEETITRADKHLYKGKQAGKNQVVVD